MRKIYFNISLHISACYYMYQAQCQCIQLIGIVGNPRPIAHTTYRPYDECSERK